MTKVWLDEQGKQITGRLSSGIFFATGTFHAKGSYVLSNGQNAGWIDQDFTSFYQIFGNADKTTAGLRTEVFPVLAQNLAQRLPRTALGVPTAGTPGSSWLFSSPDCSWPSTRRRACRHR